MKLLLRSHSGRPQETPLWMPWILPVALNGHKDMGSRAFSLSLAAAAGGGASKVATIVAAAAAVAVVTAAFF